MADALVCTGPPTDVATGSMGLRIGAIFIIGASSLFATMFPVITKRAPRVHIPNGVFLFCKYFGSGVIIATAFIHLLAPAASDEELTSPCLNSNFQAYPFAFAFSMIAVFVTFVVEMVAFRVGAELAQKLAYDPHIGGHHHAAEHGHVQSIPTPVVASPAVDATTSDKKLESQDSNEDEESDDLNDIVTMAKQGNKEGLSAAASEILGVGILEFGVIFHSVIIGITLGTTPDFTILFIVIIFHQMFEGLGLGTRLALLPLEPRSWIPYIGAAAYALVTPIGMAIGLGIRSTYNGDSTKAALITGIFDSVSSGILLYTGLVELLAHEFIFNDKMRKAPLHKVMLAIFEMLLGAGIMALLGRWA